MQLSYLQIRNPKDDEIPVDAAVQLFSSLLTNDTSGFWKQLFGGAPPAFAFEIFLLNQQVFYYITIPKHSETFITSLLSSTYPHSATQPTTDPVAILYKSAHVSIGELALATAYYYPFKTYPEFGTVDTLGTTIGYLTKLDNTIKVGIQFLVTAPTFNWHSEAIAKTKPKTVSQTALAQSAAQSAAGQFTGSPGATPTQDDIKAALVQRKVTFLGGKVCMRMVVAANKPGIPTAQYLQNLAGTYGGFALGEGNRLVLKTPGWDRTKLLERFRTRITPYSERTRQILNAQELASLWHPPGMSLSGIKNIAWGRTLAGEPPENLPVAEGLTEDQRREINFFAKTEFRNQQTTFGLKNPDRRRHVYIIGKTGAGKSTLIANMAIDDIRKDRGVGIIDPHGDLCDTILKYIPKRRINDVIYLEPFDAERPFALNVLEVKNQQHKHLVASGIVSIFAKLYHESWGPRLEYILRNVILTLLEIPGATLCDILPLLAQEKFRKKLVPKITDPVIRNFWEREFEVMPDRLKAEAISPIQNKVGQFVSTKMIRNIIGQAHSTVDLEDIMNSGKIMILNLSQGKLGEDNAALLGAMVITQIQVAAMQRSFMQEEDRRDFMLYVDEFQNFATSSFVKILSEARKYRLCLNLTNQYINQLDETIRSAIFGNIGTLASFVVGASDADILSKEYGGLYTANDLVSLGKHEIVLKLSIDNMMSAPFPAKTLPLPELVNDNSEKIIKLSKERYGRTLPSDNRDTADYRHQQQVPEDFSTGDSISQGISSISEALADNPNDPENLPPQLQHELHQMPKPQHKGPKSPTFKVDELKRKKPIKKPASQAKKEQPD